MCKFKAYNVLPWYSYMLQNNYPHVVLTNISTTSHKCHLFLWWEYLRSTVLEIFKYMTQYSFHHHAVIH